MNKGEEIGNYVIEDFIGEGGMGTVYRVTNKDDGKSYALKVCIETDEKSIRRFKREVRIQENIDHKNIIKVLDKDFEGKTPYFVMPLAVNSVSDISGTLCGNIEKTYDIFKEICDGISATHLSGNYHRDIKPSNVLIFSDGTVKVSDFGLAKMVVKDSSSHSSSNNFIGTVGYHAPEQIQGKNADHRTDVFQLGKTFYQMFTCDYPHLINPKRLPSGLAYIVQKATTADPDDRYQNVSDLKQAIFTFIQAQNPKKNPVQALESKLFEIDKMQKSGFYDEDIYISYIDLLDSLSEDIDTFLLFFDKVPEQALKIFASQLSERFLPFMESYTTILKKYFEENHVNFGYAETVADRMQIIFNNTTNTEIKGLALLNTLRVAHWLNRFNAMDTFDLMLQEIKSDEDANHIAQILNDEIEIYKSHADRIADKYLHSAIIDIKNKTLPKQKPDQPKTPDWLKELLEK